MINVGVQLSCDECFKSSSDTLLLIGTPEKLHDLFTKAKRAGLLAEEKKKGEVF